MTQRLLLVAPRPPREDGRGDQRVAWDAARALERDWEVEVISWLPDLDLPRRTRALEHPIAMARTLALSLVRPVFVAYTLGHMPRSARRSVRSSDHDVKVFITSRGMPRRVPPHAVVNFVDDVGGAALARVDARWSPRSWFRRFEGARTRRVDRRIVERAAVAVAHSQADSDGLGPGVGVVRLAPATAVTADDGDRVLFLGNLFYEPNDEAGRWICTDLVPALVARGVAADRVVVAGRMPTGALRSAAERAGIDLRADFASAAPLFRDAAVVIAPMAIGVGALLKLVDAVAAGRATVLTPLANEGLGLVDGRSALVRARDADGFATAIAELLADRPRRALLAASAREALAEWTTGTVHEQWRAAVRRAAG